MKDADKYARNSTYSESDNPLGWLYDQFGRPVVNSYYLIKEDTYRFKK